ncbi:MAG: diguanylate cyclase [Nitrospirae bacterium]|nr:diguanylate cyclase [Nitrospirota bacterium]
MTDKLKKKDPDNYTIRVSKEIRRLLLDAIKQKGWFFFKNPHLHKCWEEMKCTKTDCPSYKSSNLRCWQVSGTFCLDKPQGDFAKKYGDCQKCRVYKKATERNVLLKIGEDFNNLMFQLKNKEDELRLNIQHSQEKNRELKALNEKINKLVMTLDKRNVLLRELSIKDGLTGLYNYRFFREILNEQYNLAKRFRFPLSCIMIDIDYFKAVNDTYGHQAGDAILSQLADILRHNVRDADKAVRYGGEEFVIMLPYTDSGDAYIKAERLRQVVSNYPFITGKNKVSITVSLGIATYTDNKNIKRAEQLVVYADKALYQAKQRGRNQTVIHNFRPDEKESGGKAGSFGGVTERRKYPRVQTLIKIKGTVINNRERFSGNAFDISYSGLCFLSSNPLEVNRRVSVSLYLPDIAGKVKKTHQINVDGLLVWCKRISEYSGKYIGSSQKSGIDYLVGIQLINISKKDSAYLQKYFVSMFKKEKYYNLIDDKLYQ